MNWPKRCFTWRAGGRIPESQTQPGEEVFYGVYPRDGAPDHTAFAHVAYLPNSDRTGNVRILAGRGWREPKPQAN